MPLVSLEEEHLELRHNAGFFSCCGVYLSAAIRYHNKFGRPAKKMILGNFLNKYLEGDETIHYYFEPPQENLELPSVGFGQFSDYTKFDYEKLNLYMNAYFTPTKVIRDLVDEMVKGLPYNPEEMASIVFRRGDKIREFRNNPQYDDFVKQAETIKDDVKHFLVQTDEKEFFDYFHQRFPNSSYIESFPPLPKITNTMHWDKVNRLSFGSRLLAVFIVNSKCKHLLTTSGNCGLFVALFRGHANNLGVFSNDLEWLFDNEGPEDK